jgi:hypothetical protein
MAGGSMAGSFVYWCLDWGDKALHNAFLAPFKVAMAAIRVMTYSQC